MARGRNPRILVDEMVVDAYIERHSLICCPRGRRRAIERLGAGWPLLLSSPTYLPHKVTLPSSHTNLPSGGAPAQPEDPCREGGGRMVRVHVEVREGDDLREVTVYADSISQAVGQARERFPGRAADR